MLPELGLDDRLVAVGADAVAERGLGVLPDVGLDLLPVVAVVAHLLAVGADRQQAAQLLDVRHCPLEIADTIGEEFLQLHHPYADLEAPAARSDRTAW
jgi:hypothetical protein